MFKTAANRCQWSPRQPGRGELSPFHLVPAPSLAPHESWKKDILGKKILS